MIRLNDIVVKFGDFTALHSINVHVKEGEFFTFLGPSGCGKTTTLRTITGFIEPAEGSVVVKGRDITRVPIEDRNIGILDKAGRTEEETEAVKAFAEWFGSAETQAAWGEEFDSYPCNTAAADILYPDGIPAIYTLKNFALTKVDGTDMTYAEYVAEHSSEWTNIMTNLGFYWADASAAVAEPDWANLDWATLTQKAA